MCSCRYYMLVQSQWPDLGYTPERKFIVSALSVLPGGNAALGGAC